MPVSFGIVSDVCVCTPRSCCSDLLPRLLKESEVLTRRLVFSQATQIRFAQRFRTILNKSSILATCIIRPENKMWCLSVAMVTSCRVVGGGVGENPPPPPQRLLLRERERELRSCGNGDDVCE